MGDGTRREEKKRRKGGREQEESRKRGGKEEIVERESKIYDLLSMVDQTKKDLKMSGWVHMPKTSDVYLYYSMDCGNYEAFAHMTL